MGTFCFFRRSPAGARRKKQNVPFARFLQTRERASHRRGHRVLLALGLTLDFRPDHHVGPAVRDLPCHPRFPGDRLFNWVWPTPGPANLSEPPIIRPENPKSSRFRANLGFIFVLRSRSYDRSYSLARNAGRGECRTELVGAVEHSETAICVAHRQTEPLKINPHQPSGIFRY